MATGIQKGVPVSQDELNELTGLRSLFDPATSLKTLDDFALWLFASAGTLGALATAGRVVGVGDLTDRGKRYFTWAILLFGIALALAALARAPQPSRFNPHNVLSMRGQLHRILLLRYGALGLAALLFGAALLLAAFAPLQSTSSRQRAPTALTYSVQENGVVNGTLAVRHGKAFSVAQLTASTRPRLQAVPLPKLSAELNGDGAASLTLRLSKTNGYRVVVLRGTWTTRDGGSKSATIRLALRKKLAVSGKHRKTKH